MSIEKSPYLLLLNKLLAGTITPEEREMLDVLASEDTEKKILLLYLEERSKTKQDTLEAEIIYEKTKPNDLSPLTIKPFRSRRSLRYINLFAGVGIASVIVFTLVMAGWFSDTKKPISRIVSKSETIFTDKGERKFFKLNDGTEVWLNNESRLTISEGYGVKHRKLELIGEGYFAVTKHKHLPLHINAQGAEIQVLGTIFNLRAYPDERSIVTSLIEGKVKLKVVGEMGNKEYLLSPGDKIEVANRASGQDQPISESVNLDLTETVAYKKLDVKDQKVPEAMWIDNKLVFNADSLSDAVKKMERWYNKTIVVQEKALNSQVFTGVFEEETCEQVLDLLKETGVVLTYTIKNDTLFIK